MVNCEGPKTLDSQLLLVHPDPLNEFVIRPFIDLLNQVLASFVSTLWKDPLHCLLFTLLQHLFMTTIKAQEAAAERQV